MTVSKETAKSLRIGGTPVERPSRENRVTPSASGGGVVDRVRRGIPAVRDAYAWARGQISFWSFMVASAALALVYLFLIAEPQYMSEAIISINGQPSGLSSLGSLVGGGMLGSQPSGQDAALLAYMQSPAMLDALDKKVHLRASYSATDRSWINRMDSEADWETMLQDYLSTIDVQMQQAAGLIDLQVFDRDPKRARLINEAIVQQSITFMNGLSDSVRDATLRTAKNEFNAAMLASTKAQPYERDMAFQRLQAAQNGLAQVSSLASQQQVFLVRVTGPSLPTEITRPEYLLDFASIMACAVCIYVIGFLVFQNIKDHRRV